MFLLLLPLHSSTQTLFAVRSGKNSYKSPDRHFSQIWSFKKTVQRFLFYARRLSTFWASPCRGSTVRKAFDKCTSNGSDRGSNLLPLAQRSKEVFFLSGAHFDKIWVLLMNLGGSRCFDVFDGSWCYRDDISNLHTICRSPDDFKALGSCPLHPHFRIQLKKKRTHTFDFFPALGQSLNPLDIYSHNGQNMGSQIQPKLFIIIRDSRKVSENLKKRKKNTNWSVKNIFTRPTLSQFLSLKIRRTPTF